MTKEEKDAWYKEVSQIKVVCGMLAEIPDKKFIGGCGKPVSIMEAYACVDCSAPFHRKCLLKHLQEDMETTSLTKMPLEEAFKKIDEMQKPI